MTGQVISPELREWVVAQLAAGHSIPSLRASMRDAGWHADAADAALAEVEAQSARLAAVAPARTSMPGPDLSDAPLYIDTGDRRVQEAELEYIAGSVAARTTIGENYVGLPFEED